MVPASARRRRWPRRGAREPVARCAVVGRGAAARSRALHGVLERRRLRSLGLSRRDRDRAGPWARRFRFQLRRARPASDPRAHGTAADGGGATREAGCAALLHRNVAGLPSPWPAAAGFGYRRAARTLRRSSALPPPRRPVGVAHLGHGFARAGVVARLARAALRGPRRAGVLDAPARRPGPGRGRGPLRCLRRHRRRCLPLAQLALPAARGMRR